MRLLLIEDDDFLREEFAALLQDEGHQVQAAASAEEAEPWLEADEPVDVLITDVSLPGRSGLDLVAQVLARRPQQKVVVCTGYRMSLPAAWGDGVRLLPKECLIDELPALLRALSSAGPLPEGPGPCIGG